jgi:beta-galactosidase
MKKYPLCLLLVLVAILKLNAQNINTSTTNFNKGWQFVKDIDTTKSINSLSATTPGTIKWTDVSLPHTAHIEPVNKVVEQWQGTCYYRKSFIIPAADKGKHIAIQFDGAMHEADVFLNGKHIYKHLGGFLPFYIDISNSAKIGSANIILIKLNNQDSKVIPPAKPMKDLDFNYYGGIYRNVYLIVKDKLHISNAVQASRVAGGGILLHDEDVSDASARIVVKTDIDNDNHLPQKANVKITLLDDKGVSVASVISPNLTINANSFGAAEQSLTVTDPKLWSPANPYLYHLKVQVLHNEQVVDEQNIRTGIKTIRFAADGFYLNNKKFVIRGTNRHQEYPYIGYALSDNAQYRDAYKIKSAGFNFVRCSHYPPSPAYLDACDELGIMVMDATPGWQYFGNAEFQANSYQNIRDMIRRDRNHTSVVLWEASLNETDMSKAYMDSASRIVHYELPFKEVFSTGWEDYAYDVFNPARQHLKAPDYWKKYSKDKPLLLAEYGDWEYYAQNAGFNQTEYKNLTKEEKSSRQVRGDGQERLLQQALNFQEAHNDNLNGRIVGDVNWLMFDYKRGYATDLETSGIMDIFRVPKFSYYFYQSQLDAAQSKPMAFIASYWNDTEDKTVKVYSNCDEVELKLNGNVIARQKPDTGRNANNLNHPPFTFHVPSYTEGTLQATGYIAGKSTVTTSVSTPGKPYKIILKADYSGKRLKAGSKDAIFIYAYVQDKDGNTVPDAANIIKFSVDGGPGEVIGNKLHMAEAGISSSLIMGGDKPGNILVKATSDGLILGTLSLPLQ